MSHLVLLNADSMDSKAWVNWYDDESSPFGRQLLQAGIEHVAMFAYFARPAAILSSKEREIALALRNIDYIKDPVNIRDTQNDIPQTPGYPPGKKPQTSSNPGMSCPLVRLRKRLSLKDQYRFSLDLMWQLGRNAQMFKRKQWASVVVLPSQLFQIVCSALAQLPKHCKDGSEGHEACILAAKSQRSLGVILETRFQENTCCTFGLIQGHFVCPVSKKILFPTGCFAKAILN